MPVFPPAPAIAVIVDGRELPTYVRAYVARGRAYAPVSPLLRLLVDRMWLDGGTLVVEREARRVRVRLAVRSEEDLDASYVAIGPLLRALGERVWYRARERCLEVRTPAPKEIASPTPFRSSAAKAPLRAVFTPEPPVTPRPEWSGPPVPRRTPLPLPPRRWGRARR